MTCMEQSSVFGAHSARKAPLLHTSAVLGNGVQVKVSSGVQRSREHHP